MCVNMLFRVSLLVEFLRCNISVVRCVGWYLSQVVLFLSIVPNFLTILKGVINYYFHVILFSAMQTFWLGGILLHQQYFSHKYIYTDKNYIILYTPIILVGKMRTAQEAIIVTGQEGEDLETELIRKRSMWMLVVITLSEFFNLLVQHYTFSKAAGWLGSCHSTAQYDGWLGSSHPTNHDPVWWAKSGTQKMWWVCRCVEENPPLTELWPYNSYIALGEKLL